MARRKRDYYLVLGVARDASDTELKRAFRELARKHHPDVSPDNNGEAFREVNEAYAVLSDRDSRARYDRWGHQDDSSGLSAVVEAAQDIINDVFRRRRGKTRGRDLRYTLELTFEQAAFGVSKTIEIPAGTGDGRTREFTVVIAPGVPDGIVKTFKGEGEPDEHHRHRQDDAALGPVRVEETCPERGPERVGVEGEQGERDREACHRRVEAQALHADEQADRGQRASMAPCQRQGNALDDEQRGDHDRGDRAANAHGRRDVDAVVERDARGDVVRAHHERDQQQRRERGAGERGRAGRSVGHSRSPRRI